MSSRRLNPTTLTAWGLRKKIGADASGQGRRAGLSVALARRGRRDARLHPASSRLFRAGAFDRHAAVGGQARGGRGEGTRGRKSRAWPIRGKSGGLKDESACLERDRLMAWVVQKGGAANVADAHAGRLARKGAIRVGGSGNRSGGVGIPTPPLLPSLKLMYRPKGIERGLASWTSYWGSCLLHYGR